VIKTAWYWHKNRYEVQWNRIEDMNMIWYIISYSYAEYDSIQLYPPYFLQSHQNIQWRIDSLKERLPFFLQVICLQKSETRSIILALCASMNSKWIKDSNIRPKTLKLVQERTVNTVWMLLKKLNIDLPYDPAIPLLGIYPMEWDSGYSKAPAHPCLLQHYSQ
jgi:hypothetical protein